MARQSSLADFLMRPRGGWRGLMVVIGLGVVGNLVAAIVTVWVGASAWWLAVLALSILALLCAMWAVSQPGELVLVPEGQQPGQYPGLIVLVGTGRPGEDPMDQSAGDAIRYHQPDLKVCWLIASSGSGGSLPVAQEIKEQYQTESLELRIHTVADPFSVQDTYDIVERIYATEVPEGGLIEERVIADFTGGVKPMSAGMILACGETRPMQYTYGRKPPIATVPRLVEFQPRRGEK